jgi:DNA-binding XRE family transcriptional regulator
MNTTTKEKAPKLRIAVPTEKVRDEFQRRLGKSAADSFDIFVLSHHDDDHGAVLRAVLGSTSALPEFMLIMTTDFDRLIGEALDDAEDHAAAEAHTRAAGEERVPIEVVDRLLAGESPIRVWREFRKMTLDQLGAAAGLSKGYLSDLENGKRAGPVETLQALARALRVSLDELAPAKN